jgi:arginase
VTTVLIPEWQGYGVSTAPADGARALARAWWGEPPALTIEPPPIEALATEDGVLGLRSITGQLTVALAALRERHSPRLQMVGGTCGVELAPVSCLNEQYAGDLAVLWFDAHADLNTPASSPSGHFHGMALRTLLGDGPDSLTRQLPRPLRQDQVFLVGARDLDPDESDFVAASRVTHVRDEVFANPDVLVAQLRARGLGHVYLHFDVDVINPDDFGNALMHAPGGPSLAAVARAILAVHRDTHVVGFSVLEYCDRSPADRDRLVDVLLGTAIAGAVP